MLGPAYIIINCQLETFPHYIQYKTPAVGTNNDIMGIQGQHYMLWASSDISFDNLVILLEHRLNERRRSHLTERVRPKVVVDASLLGYKVLGSNNVHDHLSGRQTTAPEGTNLSNST